MKVLVAGTIDVPPEHRDQALIDGLPYIQDALTEAGCIAYSWTADLSIPGRICVFEEWTDEADLAVHLVAPSYTNMLVHLRNVGVIDAKTLKYRVDKDAPVYNQDGIAEGFF